MICRSAIATARRLPTHPSGYLSYVVLSAVARGVRRISR